MLAPNLLPKAVPHVSHPSLLCSIALLSPQNSRRDMRQVGVGEHIPTITFSFPSVSPTML
jgi:hypothetical protein